MTIEQNTYYRGYVTLEGIQSIATNSLVINKIIDLGFTDVKAEGKGKNRIATGKWLGTTREYEPPKTIRLEKM